jgi:dipeptidyl-peptidase-4
MMYSRRSSLCIALAFLSSTMPMVAQKVYTDKDYAQAERWMSYNVNDLVHHTIRGVEYLSDGRVFYRDPGAGGTAYMIADPGKSSVAPAFDNEKLATALSVASKKKVEAGRLGVTEYKAEAGGEFSVTTRAGEFHCDAAGTKCTAVPEPTEEKTAEKPGTKAAAKAPAGRRNHAPENVSPDKSMAAFIRDNNLWVKVLATGEEKQLTTDGVEDFGYATDNAGWQHSDAAILTWSADGKKIATFQQDQRKTGMMYLVPVTNRHPKLEAWRYPLVGDKDVTMIEPVIIDVASAKMTRLQTAPLEHRSMECDATEMGAGTTWSFRLMIASWLW